MDAEPTAKRSHFCSHGAGGYAQELREFKRAGRAADAVGSLSEHLFIFRNRRADKLKALYWDRDGYALWYKQLEEGTFRITLPDEGARDAPIEMRPADLAMMLDGVDLASVKRQKRWQREPTRDGTAVEKSSSQSH
jgi:transposase